jgi:hypothetical protein
VVLKQKQVLMYAGIGLAVSGIATIFLIYQSTLASDSQGGQTPLVPATGEFALEEVHANPALVMHIHAQIEVQKAGQKVPVPAEIGIARELWHDHSLDQFGPSKALLAPLHTHDGTGTIHIESVVNRDYTLGEFLSIWGMDAGKVVKATSSEAGEIEDFQNHVLARNEKITLEIAD